MKRNHVMMSPSTLAAALLAAGLAACGAEAQDSVPGLEGAVALSSALEVEGLASIEKPSFNVRGIEVEADAEGLHIRGAFPGGNPGFMPPAFTMLLDGHRIIIIDASWAMKTPKALAERIRTKLESKYEVRVDVRSDDDVLVQLRKRDAE
jgi:hypothetical protein